MSTSETVETLLALQDIDEEIRRRQDELESLAPDVEAAEDRVSEIRDELDAVREQLEEAEQAYRSDQRSIEAGRQTLKRLKDRAEDVQNMKQHQAVRAELATARQNLQKAEDDALDSLQRVESSKERVKELEEELEEAEEEHRRRAEDVESRRKELQDELAEQRDRREERTGHLDDNVLALYEKVRKGRTPDVLAPLNGDHCGHCFTMVPPQRRNEIRSGRQLYRCEGCGVILHSPNAAGD